MSRPSEASNAWAKVGNLETSSGPRWAGMLRHSIHSSADPRSSAARTACNRRLSSRSDSRISMPSWIMARTASSVTGCQGQSLYSICGLSDLVFTAAFIQILKRDDNNRSRCPSVLPTRGIGAKDKFSKMGNVFLIPNGVTFHDAGVGMQSFFRIIVHIADKDFTFHRHHPLPV